jgi:hypothetical protein
MSAKIDFEMPRGMTPTDVATVFNIYLLGLLALENKRRRNNKRINYGPFKKDKKSDLDWQLDVTNDYFLHVKGSTATLACRYDVQEPVIWMMFMLFRLRYMSEQLTDRSARDSINNAVHVMKEVTGKVRPAMERATRQ